MSAKKLLPIILSPLLLTSCGYVEMTKEEFGLAIGEIIESNDPNKIKDYKYEIHIKGNKGDSVISYDSFTSYDRKSDVFTNSFVMKFDSNKYESKTVVITTPEYCIYEKNGEKKTYYSDGSANEKIQYEEYSTYYQDYLKGNTEIDYVFSPNLLLEREKVYPIFDNGIDVSAKKNNNSYLLNWKVEHDEEKVFVLTGEKRKASYRYIDMKFDSNFFLLSGRREGDLLLKGGWYFGGLKGIYDASFEYKGSVNYL